MNFLKDLIHKSQNPLLDIAVAIIVVVAVAVAFSLPANAQQGVNHFTFEVKEEGGDLKVYLNDEYMKYRIPGIRQYSQDKQDKIINQLTSVLRFCASKGNWAHDVAFRAGLDPRPSTIKSEIDNMYETWTEAKHATLVDGERIVRVAYKRGHENPYEFAYKQVRYCIKERF